jgi:molybdate-binding protein/DNA-binding XRE family transcriptional regulator
MDSLQTSLRLARSTAGLSQHTLAQAAGVSRQAYASVESGKAVPSTLVALRLARALGTTVEDLFRIPADAGETVEADLAGEGSGSLGDGPVRMGLYQVGDHHVARALEGGPKRTGVSHTLPLAHGIGRRGSDPSRVLVERWQGASTSGLQTLVAVGCDPAMGLVSATMQHLNVELARFEDGSWAALEQIALGQAHVAGCHLLDEPTGQFNLPWVERLIPFPTTLVTFAVWEQGLLVAPGNPKGIRGVADLTRPGVFMVNREAGSGSRALLDRALREAGVSSELLAGYTTEVRGHLLVGEVVAMGLADVGVGVKAAAVASGLDFVPLGQERYDLVIPDHFLDYRPVQLLLSALADRDFKQQVEALGGYDTALMGTQPSAA